MECGGIDVLLACATSDCANVVLQSCRVLERMAYEHGGREALLGPKGRGVDTVLDVCEKHCYSVQQLSVWPASRLLLLCFCLVQAGSLAQRHVAKMCVTVRRHATMPSAHLCVGQRFFRTRSRHATSFFSTRFSVARKPPQHIAMPVPGSCWRCFSNSLEKAGFVTLQVRRMLASIQTTIDCAAFTTVRPRGLALTTAAPSAPVPRHSRSRMFEGRKSISSRCSLSHDRVTPMADHLTRHPTTARTRPR